MLVQQDELEQTDSAEDGKAVSEAAYWQNYYRHDDFSYEWNNGRLELMPSTNYGQSQLYFWFLDLLNRFLLAHPIGRMIGLKFGFRLALINRIAIRRPDLAVVLNTNTIPLGDKDRSYRGIFDLCVESLSDYTEQEVIRDTITKRQEYAEAGVKEYYILDKSGQESAFYHLNADGVYVPIQPINGVIRSHVLPGFQFRLADLYHLPEPPQLIADDVYNHFISPHLRAERERAERYAALLRSLGVDPDAPQPS